MVKKNFLSLILIILMSFAANRADGQMYSSDTFSYLHTYASAGVNMLVHGKDYFYSPVHYRGRVGYWDAIPTNKFSATEEEWGIKRSGFAISGGVYKPAWNSRTTFHLELGLGWLRMLYLDRVRGMVFTDQIDPRQGFVQPSYMVPKELTVQYLYGFTRARMLLHRQDRKNKRPRQGVGFGLLGTYLLQSSYQIKAVDSRDEITKYYSDKDLTASDYVLNLAPEVSYQFYFTKIAGRTLYFDALFALPATYFIPKEEVVQRSKRGGMLTFRVVVCKD